MASIDLTRREKDPSRPATPDVVVSQVILANVRVLAIDQAPKEKDGQNVAVGKTVTLELKPEQTQILAMARQAGTLSLALRSMADNKAVVENIVESNRRGETVNIVRFGVPSSATTQK